jgi:hypothetical protein
MSTVGAAPDVLARNRVREMAAVFRDIRKQHVESAPLRALLRRRIDAYRNEVEFYEAQAEEFERTAQQDAALGRSREEINLNAQRALAAEHRRLGLSALAAVLERIIKLPTKAEMVAAMEQLASDFAHDAEQEPLLSTKTIIASVVSMSLNALLAETTLAEIAGSKT